jgi:predicted transcriptional regulator of viral defense system
MTEAYAGISKDELSLVSRAEYEKQKLITTAFAMKLFGNGAKAASVLSSLTRKGRLLQLQRGKYLLVPIKAPNQQWSFNEFLLAALWMGEIPYYVGYFTMYNYWGFTEQLPQTVFVLNTKRSCEKLIGQVLFKAVKIDPRKYYGVQKVKIEDEQVCISDKERTLVDFLYHPVGSFANMENVLKENINKIDKNKFIKYLERFPVASLRKRAGYLLKQNGCDESYLKRLRKSIDDNETYVVLDPNRKSRKGIVSKEWRIIVNQ